VSVACAQAIASTAVATPGLCALSRGPRTCAACRACRYACLHHILMYGGATSPPVLWPLHIHTWRTTAIIMIANLPLLCVRSRPCMSLAALSAISRLADDGRGITLLRTLGDGDTLHTGDAQQLQAVTCIAGVAPRTLSKDMTTTTIAICLDNIMATSHHHYTTITPCYTSYLTNDTPSTPSPPSALTTPPPTPLCPGRWQA
jgi:hypothetical protein